jgi:peptide/nickel transport system permease protein
VTATPRTPLGGLVDSARGDPSILASLLVVLLLVVAGFAAPLLVPHDPNEQNLRSKLQVPFEPTADISFLGGDPLGRDILSRIVFGARVSLLVAGVSVLLAGTVGVVLGVVAGFYGGWIDSVLMRVADVQLSIPFLVLALGLAAVIGPGVGNIIAVLAITGWPRYARVLRAEVLRVMAHEYVQAARAVGGGDIHLMWRHVLPNAFGVAVVVSTVQVAQMILSEASLSFLGVGVSPDVPSWGAMVADGRTYLSTAWWVSAFPGLVIWLTVVGFNILGDWLVDYADPAVRST